MLIARLTIVASAFDTVRSWFRSKPLYDLGQQFRTGARDLNDPQVRRTRMLMGGGLYRSNVSPTTPYLNDLDTAVEAADIGQLRAAAQLLQACDQHPVVQGLMATRTAGLTRLPVKWAGDPEAIGVLKQGVIAGAGPDDPNSLYDYLVPPLERSRFSEDAIKLGVAVGEVMPTTSGLPMFRQLDPAGLQYRVDTNTWIYNSVAGPVNIDPGVWPDDRESAFVLYTAGRTTPWRRGIWKALVQAYIVSLHALMYRSAWESRLANPAVFVTTPLGWDGGMDDEFLTQIQGWGLNTTFLAKSGAEVDLLQSNGIGYESFTRTIDQQAEQIIYLISGNTVVADGGSGFQNASLYRAIRGDLIQADANGLSQVENFQILPLILEAMGFGDRSVTREYVTTPPAELSNEAQTLVQVASAITGLTQAFVAAGATQQLDIAALCTKYNIPVRGDGNGDGEVDERASEATGDVRLRAVETQESAA